MVKSYLRYELARAFGVVASATSNAVWIPSPAAPSSAQRTTGAGQAVVAANERVLTWDIKKGELVSSWQDAKCAAEVTCLAQSRTDADIFAAGYGDGSIRLWDRATGTVVISFNGHRAAVSALCFDRSGTRLASGGKDAHVIVWDLIAETGLYRLRGHKDQVTAVEFLQAREGEEGEEGEEADADADGWLLTTGKDALIKLWDLSTQHCVETHVAHQGECWALALSPDMRGCITAGNDGEMKVWALDTGALPARATADADCVVSRGTLYRAGKDRAVSMSFHPRGSYVAVHGADKNVEIWRIRSEDEVRRALKRKRKRREAKGIAVDEDAENIAHAEVGDLFVSHVTVRAGGKVRSVDWAVRSGTKTSSEGLQLLVACSNNSLEFYDVEKASESKKGRKKGKEGEKELPEYNKLYSVELPGHRTDIRALALSSNDRMLASASQGLLKIWNVRTAACIRTFECGYAVDCAFLPGDGIVVVGTKTGELELFDVASSSLIESIKAHEGGVWSLQVHPSGKSLVSGGADKRAAFWDFQIVSSSIPGTKRSTPRLHLLQTRVLQLTDDVLSVRFTPDGRLLALALLDNTVKVFFTDTLKLFLTLYGHKLPVLNMDVSSDSALLATCSADKNVKLWGLAFGDCHKSFFAHGDSIMAVRFARGSHAFFSAAKDRLVRYWDGDKFERILTLHPPHHGHVWALATGNTSDMVVSAAHDREVRVWEQTDEPVFLEEERERELEELYENTLTASLADPSLDPSLDPSAEAGPAGKQTAATLTAGEKLIEALELGLADLAALDAHRAAQAAAAPTQRVAPPARNALYVALGNVSAESHVLRVLERVPSAQLADALLVLPFHLVGALLAFLAIFAERAWNVPLTCRVLAFVLRTHHAQIVASGGGGGGGGSGGGGEGRGEGGAGLRPALHAIAENLRAALKRQRDTVGFNAAGVRYVRDAVRQRATSVFADEQAWVDAQERARRKRAFASVA